MSRRNSMCKGLGVGPKMASARTQSKFRSLEPSWEDGRWGANEEEKHGSGAVGASWAAGNLGFSLGRRRVTGEVEQRRNRVRLVP